MAQVHIADYTLRHTTRFPLTLTTMGEGPRHDT